MLPSRWDLVDTRDGVRRHPVTEPPMLELAEQRDSLQEAGVSVVGDEEDSMVGRLVANIAPHRRTDRSP